MIGEQASRSLRFQLRNSAFKASAIPCIRTPCRLQYDLSIDGYLPGDDNRLTVDDDFIEKGSKHCLLIRHATTDMAGTLCGQIDPPLNTSGKEQAAALGRLLRLCSVQRLYASDLRRAVETALPLAALWNIPILERADLREISFGLWEGKSWAEIRDSGRDITAMETLPEFAAPEGETFACFRNRILQALEQIIDDSGRDTVAIVAHLGVLRVILSEVASKHPDWDPKRRIDYCAVYRFRVTGRSMELIGELKANAEETNAVHRTE